MKIKEGFILRSVAGVDVVLAVEPASEWFRATIKLNPVGKFIWQQLEKGSDEDGIVSALLDAYDVDEATARRDVRSFIGRLTDAGVLDV